MSNAEGGSLRMEMGKQYAGEEFFDAIGNCQEPVLIDEEGFGEFRTEGGNVAVWLRKNAFENLIVNE